ncbi:MAG: hypothetical protein KM310_00635 [Clostridiales bacterium]|nr:hypothetical protein [Clostridiales bacterium]
MHCPYCDHPETVVLETRLKHHGRTVRRRRACPHCSARFTTYEEARLSPFKKQPKDPSTATS